MPAQPAEGGADEELERHHRGDGVSRAVRRRGAHRARQSARRSGASPAACSPSRSPGGRRASPSPRGRSRGRPRTRRPRTRACSAPSPARKRSTSSSRRSRRDPEAQRNGPRLHGQAARACTCSSPGSAQARAGSRGRPARPPWRGWRPSGAGRRSLARGPAPPAPRARPAGGPRRARARGPPVRMSSPRGRTYAPRWTARRITTRAPSRRHLLLGHDGVAAGRQRRAGQDAVGLARADLARPRPRPAATSPTTASVTGRSWLAAAVSAARTA